MARPRWLRELLQWLRSGLAGALATGVDLGVLALLVSGFGVSAHWANVPALIAGGVANFLGNRHFAFRAKGGSLTRQAIGYTAVEVVALVLNGVLYDLALRMLPGALPLYWLVRVVTSHLVFLCWSYPLWRKVFRGPEPIAAA
jgi:putative flippase GtrA